MMPRRAPWRAAAALLVSFAVSRGASAQVVKPPAPPLDAPARAAYARMLRMEDERRLDSARVASALHSPSAVVRDAAARALARLAPTNPAALPWLRSLLGSETGIAREAAFGLGLARDSASAPMLARVVRSGAPAAREAAWSLGQLGGAARDSIAALLAEQPGDTTTITALLLAYAQARPLNATPAAAYLHHHARGVRWAAAYAIARPHLASGVRALLADSADPAVRALVATGLTSKAAGDSLRSPAIARLVQLAEDGDPQVRIAAVRSLATFGPSSAPAVARATHDADPQVRVAAAQASDRAFTTDTAAWRAAWAADTAYGYRKALVQSAALAGMAPEFRAVQQSPDWRMRAVAARAALDRRDSAAARRELVPLAGDADARVRAAAYAALRSLDPLLRDTAAAASLARGAADPDSVARRAAAGDTVMRTAPPRRHDDSWYARVVDSIVIPTLRHQPPTARVATERGGIVVSLAGSDAPMTVENFSALARARYFDGFRFHRVVPAFVAQDGDPRGDGEGGPGYSIRDELSLLPYSRGAVGMALSGPDTGGSQYFFTLSPQPHLEGRYTVFGRVVAGFHVMDALREGDRILSVRIQ